jgi:ABC-2 type transport system permease protein
MAVLRALPDLMRVGFAGTVAYRAEMVIWILSTLLPLVLLALWTAVADGGPVAGFGEVEFARYFAVTLLVRQIGSLWLVWELNYEIRSGKLSTKLLRPMHPLVQYATDMSAALPLRVVVMAPMLLALIAWRPELWRTPSVGSAALFVVSMALAWCMNFGIQALFAILAFWFDKSDAVFGVWFSAWSLLSGYLAPLALFPAAVRPLLIVLPFRGQLGLPVEILGGFIEPVDALPEVGIQLLWVIGLFLAVRWSWARGVVRYGAYGA